MSSSEKQMVTDTQTWQPLAVNNPVTVAAPRSASEVKPDAATAGAQSTGSGQVAMPRPESPSATVTSAPNHSEQSGSAPAQGTSIHSISSSNVSVTQEYRQYFFDDAQPSVALFLWSKQHTEVDRQDEINRSSRFIRDETFVNAALTTLRQHRLLLLTGEADCGKESMACYLAARLREDGKIGHNTLVYGPQGRDVRLHLPSALVREANLHDRVVIFRDALEYKNPHVSEFLISMKGEAVTNLAHDLERIQSYLILTCVSGTLPSGCSAAMPAWLRPSLPPLTPDLVLKGIAAHVSTFKQTLDSAYAGDELSLEQQQEIAARCSTISRAVAFIDSQLIYVLRGEKSLETAFKEFDSLSSWFQKSDTSLEAWIYCLAAVLADPLNRKEGVPWADFFTIYDMVRQRILRHRSTRANERPFDELALRAIAGVEVKRDGSYARELVAFTDPRTVERHWHILLNQFPSVATDVIPALVELTDHNSPFIRSRAAQALGRIGYLDSQTIAKPRLETWSKSESWRERSLVGYLAQGILSAGNPEYRGFLLEALDRYATERKRTWAAIAAFKQIGTIDLALSMDKLKEIARTKLAPAFEVDMEITRRLEQFNRKLATSGKPPAEIIILLDQFYVELFENAEIAQTFKYALVSLSMIAGVSSVLAHLSRWALGSPGMGALVCFVFLQKEGIAEEMTAQKQPLVSQVQSEGQGKNLMCNMVLASLIDAPEAIEGLATFLETMYAALMDFFPPDSVALLNRLLFDYCKTWVREALPIPPCRTAMIELIGRLLQSPLQELWERTYNWLASDPDFSQSEMAAFAKEARLFKGKRLE